MCIFTTNRHGIISAIKREVYQATVGLISEEVVKENPFMRYN